MFSFEYERKTASIDCAWNNPLPSGGLFRGSGNANVCKYLVCNLGKTFFHASRLAFCSRLDNALPPNGDCSWSGMVLWQGLQMGQNSNLLFLLPTAGQRPVVYGLLLAAQSHC